jgi:hypothetical protein
MQAQIVCSVGAKLAPRPLLNDYRVSLAFPQEGDVACFDDAAKVPDSRCQDLQGHR